MTKSMALRETIKFQTSHTPSEGRMITRGDDSPHCGCRFRLCTPPLEQLRARDDRPELRSRSFCICTLLWESLVAPLYLATSAPNMLSSGATTQRRWLRDGDEDCSRRIVPPTRLSDDRSGRLNGREYSRIAASRASKEGSPALSGRCRRSADLVAGTGPTPASDSATPALGGGVNTCALELPQRGGSV